MSDKATTRQLSEFFLERIAMRLAVEVLERIRLASLAELRLDLDHQRALSEAIRKKDG